MRMFNAESACFAEGNIPGAQTSSLCWSAMRVQHIGYSRKVGLSELQWSLLGDNNFATSIVFNDYREPALTDLAIASWAQLVRSWIGDTDE